MYASAPPQNTGELTMAMKITDECMSCAACEPECPKGAISQSGEKYVIDASKCDECAAKGEPSCKSVCPADSIVKA
jgi:ferredoxin